MRAFFIISENIPDWKQGEVMKHKLSLVITVLALFGLYSFAHATPPAPLPQTGQISCYDTAGTNISCAGTGQDGELRAGVLWPFPRFTDNGNGTVTDNLTGLIWLQNANCFGTQSWTYALYLANSLASGKCGLSDSSSVRQWRLPNINELESLMPYNNSNVIFTDVKFVYWSSSSQENLITNAWSNAWVVNMSGDEVFFRSKTDSYYVWPVRAGQ